MKWNLRKKLDSRNVQEFAASLNVPEVIAEILLNRGYINVEDVKKFFNCDWDSSYDPFLMKDMEKAVKRVVKAIENKEKILIYGDYDVDGVTSVSLLSLYLRELGGIVCYYIPNRLTDGYGLSRAGIGKAVEVGASLIITVDCGIKGDAEISYAKKMGIETIISDHHKTGKTIPKACAVLNPKQKECSYPFKELAGVGVAFKLIQAINIYLNNEDEKYRKFVDLTALGSAADIVPLIDENRMFVKKGLERINSGERIGMYSLVKSSGLTGKNIGTGQVVFRLAPRINAVGRMGNAERAVRLMTADSSQQADNIAEILESENRKRKEIDDETFREALEMLESVYDSSKDKAVVLSREGWHSGVIGIVASRIAEKIYRPTVMIAIENGLGKGSARSIGKFNIYSALKQCSTDFISFGGHKYAAGLTIEIDKIAKFRENFMKISSDLISEDELIKRLVIDAEIKLSEITDEFFSSLKLFKPYGPKNMRPVFLSRNLQVVGSPRIVGRDHLKFRVQQGNKVFDAIGFNLGSLFYRLTPGESNLDMVYVIEENYWNGNVRLQLRVKDLK